MNLTDLLSSLGSTGLLVILATLIQISPIKVDPWSALGDMLNKNINTRVDGFDKRIEQIDSKINSIKEEEDERDIKQCRARIIRFGDEVRHGQVASKDHFDQILIDIDDYNDYCESHPSFRNSVTVSTTEMLKENYKKHLIEDSFLK